MYELRIYRRERFMRPTRRNTMKKQIAALQAQVRDLQAFCGVLGPVFEKEYRKQKYKWEADGKAPKRVNGRR
jgi:hypothetical protein